MNQLHSVSTVQYLSLTLSLPLCMCVRVCACACARVCLCVALRVLGAEAATVQVRTNNLCGAARPGEKRHESVLLI